MEQLLSAGANELFHQETLWPTTELAIPFPVELVSAPAASHRDSLLYLLARLSWKSSLRERIGHHVPGLVPLLSDADARVREHAA